LRLKYWVLHVNADESIKWWKINKIDVTCLMVKIWPRARWMWIGVLPIIIEIEEQFLNPIRTKSN